jgi:hypothetical protein
MMREYVASHAVDLDCLLEFSDVDEKMLILEGGFRASTVHKDAMAKLVVGNSKSCLCAFGNCCCAPSEQLLCDKEKNFSSKKSTWQESMIAELVVMPPVQHDRLANQAELVDTKS